MNIELEAPRRFFTEKQVAELLRISIKKLQSDRQLNRGLPFYRIDRCIRYAEIDLNEFLSDNRITPQPTEFQ